MPKLSEHFKRRKPSAIRAAQIEFSKRKDDVEAVNLAIGNVSLPMHPAMQERLFHPENDSELGQGIVRYTATKGRDEANQAIMNIIASSGFSTEGLYSQITSGGSQAMQLVTLGACGPAGTEENPLLLIDAAYTNYNAMAKRLGRKTVSIRRDLQDHGKFTLPEVESIEDVIKEHRPGGMVVIPYDNPTGHFYDHETLKRLGKLTVEYDMWLISDEAYRELHYTDHDTTSVWGLTEEEVPGITGRRISIETASKVWNACGLRIGALVTDNEEFHQKAVAENTAELCSSTVGQYIFGGLAHVDHEELKEWYDQQRRYYGKMMTRFTEGMKEELPDVIVSNPDASLYSVVDLKNAAKPGFDAMDFVMYCAKEGKAEIDGEEKTLLVAPMEGFYKVAEGERNPGTTQMRVAYVEKPEVMERVPKLFTDLFKQYEAQR